MDGREKGLARGTTASPGHFACVGFGFRVLKDYRPNWFSDRRPVVYE